MTPFEAATVVIGVGQVLLIAAGLLFMEAGGRRRAQAEENRHTEMMATLTTQHEQIMAALGISPEGTPPRTTHHARPPSG